MNRTFFYWSFPGRSFLVLPIPFQGFGIGNPDNPETHWEIGSGLLSFSFKEKPDEQWRGSFRPFAFKELDKFRSLGWSSEPAAYTDPTHRVIVQRALECIQSPCPVFELADMVRCRNYQIPSFLKPVNWSLYEKIIARFLS